MSKAPATKKITQAERYIGKRVRISCEADALSYHESGPTAPERITVRIGGIITVVPVSSVEIVSLHKQEARA